MTDESGHTLIMQFLDDSPSFVHGFEIGKIWNMCENKNWPTNMTVHHANERQLELLAKHFSCDLFVDLVPEYDEWLTITMVHKPKFTVVR